MQLELGKIYEGKVTGIKDYGAFVEILDEGVTGMVHISQISNEYVTHAKDYLTEGQIVKVKFIGTNEDGKIKLSIKETLPRNDSQQKRRSYQRRNNGYSASNDNLFQKRSDYESFEDMLSKFKQHSDENLSDLKRITDRRNRTRRK